MPDKSNLEENNACPPNSGVLTETHIEETKMQFELKITAGSAQEIMQAAGVLAAFGAMPRAAKPAEQAAPAESKVETVEAAEVVPVAEPQRRKRRTKAEMEADKALPAATATTEPAQIDIEDAVAETETPGDGVPDTSGWTNDDLTNFVVSHTSALRVQFVSDPDVVQHEAQPILEALDAYIEEKGKKKLSIRAVTPEMYPLVAKIVAGLKAEFAKFEGDDPAGWALVRAAVIDGAVGGVVG
jgi:hypothetical protein